MKKFLILTILFLSLFICGCHGILIIKNGVLKEYKGIDTNVNIPETVTTIEETAFYGCSSIESINIPNSVKNLQKKIFKFFFVLGLKTLQIFNNMV